MRPTFITGQLRVYAGRSDTRTRARNNFTYSTRGMQSGERPKRAAQDTNREHGSPSGLNKQLLVFTARRYSAVDNDVARRTTLSTVLPRSPPSALTRSRCSLLAP